MPPTLRDTPPVTRRAAHRETAPTFDSSNEPGQPSARRTWTFSWFNLGIALALLAGLALLIYPSAAAWISQYNQSNILFDQTRATSKEARSVLEKQLQEAAVYNDELRASALLAGGSNIAQGTGEGSDSADYWSLLTASPTGTMARLRVPSIDLDLPVYHGTSEATLQKGVGHLQGTSLPVGGEGTRSVLTGHRGLANATMFTHLNRVKKNDRFNVEVLGEVFTYEVVEIQVVDPDETEEIEPQAGRDLMTLVTCTPLGINTQRILITGERVFPTPQSDLDAMSKRPEVPGFPWWIVLLGGGVLAVTVWYWRAGRGPRTRTSAQDPNPDASEDQSEPADTEPPAPLDRNDMNTSTPSSESSTNP